MATESNFEKEGKVPLRESSDSMFSNANRTTIGTEADEMFKFDNLRPSEMN